MMFLHKLNILLLGLIALTLSSFGNGAPSGSNRRSYKEIACGQYLCNKIVRKESKSVPRTKICDGVSDCPLRDDELDCPCKPLLAPDNGRVSYTGNQRYTLTAHFTCDQGLKLIGNSSRICQPPGIWSGNNPSCTAADCGHPELDKHGDYKCIHGEGFDGSIAVLICDSGFKIASGLCIIATCENGTWTTPKESCQAVCPQFYDVDHGTVQYSGLSPSESLIPGAASASLVCNAGYELSAGALLNVHCVGDFQTAKWDGFLGACVQVPDCGQPIMLDPHGFYTIITGEGFDGSIAELTCDSGFKIVSGLCIKVACENGAWRTPSESCQAVCPHLSDVDHGTIHYSGLSPSDSLLPDAASVYFACDAGYQPSDAAILKADCVGDFQTAAWDAPLGTCDPDSVCPEGWMLFRSKCYLLGDEDTTKDGAAAYCTSLNATILVLETSEENEFVKGKIRATGVVDHHYWIGITDMDELNVWKSPTGDIETFSDWAPKPTNQPNGNGDSNIQPCVIFWYDSVPFNYLWADVPCNFPDTRPVCERPV